MFTKLRDFKKMRKSMHLSRNHDEELGKKGKRLKGTASLTNKKSKEKGSQLPDSDSDVDPNNGFEDAAVGQHRTKMDRPKKQGDTKGKRTQLPASESDVEPDNRVEVAAVGQNSPWFKSFKKLKKRNEKEQEKPKGKRSQQPASDSDVEPHNQTEVATAGDYTEHPQRQQPSMPHCQRRDFMTTSSEASEPLSSSTQASSPSSARQSPLRRSFTAMKKALTKTPRDVEFPSPYFEESPSDPQIYDKFPPSAMPGKYPKMKLIPGATNVISTDQQGPPPALSAPSPVTGEGMAGQGVGQQAAGQQAAGQQAIRQQAARQQPGGQQPPTGQGKRRLAPGAGFNPSKHRHTWPCEMIPINVPSPENAQAILHPRKDVFMLKVAKISASGDRRVKMELELVTPKYGKKLPSRLDTRETQCEPECCCPCACCPRPKSKKNKKR